MATVCVQDIIKLLKMGVDPEVFHDWEYMCEDIVKCDKEDAFYLIETFQKSMGCPDYVDVLETAIHNENCDYVNEIFECCEEKDVYEMLSAQPHHNYYGLKNFLSKTKRWDLCRDAVIHLVLEYSGDTVKYAFFDYLVTEKDIDMNRDDVFPYIHALIDSLISLPVYVVYKIVDASFHTHKYFQEWEIISMIHLAKGEDRIYTNHPEYKDAIDINNMLVSEQIKCISTLIDCADQKSLMERVKISMEVLWMLKHFTNLLKPEKFRDVVKAKCIEFSYNPNTTHHNIDFGFWYDHLTGKEDRSDKVAIFKQKYEELFDLDIEDRILMFIKTIF